MGEVVGNPLAQALEQAVRSVEEGTTVEVEIAGGPYKPELVFKVPTDHPEVQRLQGRYSSYAPLLPCTQARAMLCIAGEQSEDTFVPENGSQQCYMRMQLDCYGTAFVHAGKVGSRWIRLWSYKTVRWRK